MAVTIKMHEGFDIDHFASKTSLAGEIANDGLNDGLNGGLNDGLNLQAQIINQIRDNAGITVSKLAALIGVSKSTIEREMSIMKDNRIKYIGSKKTGHWEVIE